MATILLDSFSIPRARHGNIIVASPSAAAPAALGFRSADLMPDYNGLRSTNRLPRVSLAARRTSQRFCRRGGGGGAVVCEAQDTAVDVPDVTKATWQSMVIESDKPVLVEFWAPWCGPCRIILPVLVKLSKTYEGKLKCFKLNTDDSPDIATQYGIRSIPTVMIFKDGERKDAVIGAVPESTLITCIEKFV